MIIEHNQNGDGHIIPDYVKLLDIGLEGVIDEAQRNLALLREDDPEYLEKKAFLESVVICMQGALDYADRLAKLAFEKAKSAPTPERRAELTAVSYTHLDVYKRQDAHNAKRFFVFDSIIQCNLSFDRDDEADRLERTQLHPWLFGAGRRHPMYSTECAVKCCRRIIAIFQSNVEHFRAIL